jgi:tRNA A-37 threonylcarbamoyl transferase component Bud32
MQSPSIPPRARWGLRRPANDETPTRVQLNPHGPAEPDAARTALVLSEDSEGRRLRLRLAALGLRVRLVGTRDELLDHLRLAAVDLVVLDRQSDEAALADAIGSTRPGLEQSVLLLGPGARPAAGLRLGAKPTSQQLRSVVDELCAEARGDGVDWLHGGPAAGPLQEGLVAARFEILEGLGSGAAAHVYRVRDQLVGEEVALKLLRESCRDPVGDERLLRELRILRRLSHPGIVRPHDVGTWNGQPWFTMELLHGRTLHQRILDAGGPLANRELRRIAHRLAGALAAAHDAGVIHRDVKPGNVFVEEGGGIRLMDFGIAVAAESTARLSATGQILGTPCYVAPELLLRGSATPAVDAFGLGVSLYLAATGRLPFRGSSLGEIGQAICHSDPTPPRHHNPDLSAELDRVILSLLHKAPQRRPTTAEVEARLAP